MEQYRKQLRTQNIFSAVGALALIALIVLSLTEVIAPVGGDNRWTGFWNGFIGGGATAFAGILLLNIILNLRAMKNPDRLKKQYIKSHDERKTQIWLQSGANAYWFDAIGLLVAAIIVGYFFPEGAVCLIAALFYICVVRAILKGYFSKKL